MERRSITAVILVLVFVTAISTKSCKSILKVAEHPGIERIQKERNLHKLPIQFSIIQTGTATTLEAFVYKGGSLFRKKKLSHIAVWVKHPKGDFLFDTGLGDSIEIQSKEMSFLHRQLFKYNKEKSVKKQLILNGISTDSIKTILVSHLHWDHSSGIKDFPNATVITTEEEYEFAQSEKAHSPAFLKSQYDGKSVRWDFIKFERKPYEFFDESFDYFGDGSVIIVKLPGHTNGSIGMFLTLENGKRIFFTGDVTWSIDGFKRPSAKHTIPSNYVDLDKEELNNTIIKIHLLMADDTSLIVIPAHDLDAQKALAHFPKFQKN